MDLKKKKKTGKIDGPSKSRDQFFLKKVLDLQP